MALSKCWNPAGCPCTNVRAHYQHIALGVNHQWDVQPSQGPTPKSPPYPQDCQFENYCCPGHPAVYSKCPTCGFIKVW